MAGSASVLIAWKTFLGVLIFVTVAVTSYEFAIDYFLSCFNPRARWMQTLIADFCVNTSIVGVWFFYKESRWILRVAFLSVTLLLLGSSVTCGYILLLLFKLSSEESSKDPFYYVLVKRQNRVIGHSRGLSLLTTKMIVAAVGCLMLGLSIFAFVVDGSPFRAEILSPCMILAILDNYVNVVIFTVWVVYKEQSWINALFWIFLLVCFCSVAACAYILKELFSLSPDQPISHILVNKRNKELMSSDPLLM